MQRERTIQLVPGTKLEGDAAENRGGRTRSFVADPTRFRQPGRARSEDEYEVTRGIGKWRLEWDSPRSKLIELPVTDIDIQEIPIEEIIRRIFGRKSE